MVLLHNRNIFTAVTVNIQAKFLENFVKPGNNSYRMLAAPSYRGVAVAKTEVLFLFFRLPSGPEAAFPLPPSIPPPLRCSLLPAMRHALCALLSDSTFRIPTSNFYTSPLSQSPPRTMPNALCSLILPSGLRN